MYQLRTRFWSLTLLAIIAGCAGNPAGSGLAVDAGGQGVAAGDAVRDPTQNESRLPAFEDFPAAGVFTGDPAAVDLDSHPDAKSFRTALTREGAADARFAGHYRIVVIGCGASCKAVWAVDLEDGSLHELFTASIGVGFRSDSRLIIDNDPAYYESLLGQLSVAEVERQMKTYGPPRFWLETEGGFEQIGPRQVRIDPATRKLVPGSPVHGANRWQCSNDVEVACANGECQSTTGDGFTPMSVLIDDSGAMSVCAYSGCWEGVGEVISSNRFLVLVGHELTFSTSRDLESANEDIVVAVDQEDGVATLKAGAFAHPLICRRI